MALMTGEELAEALDVEYLSLADMLDQIAQSSCDLIGYLVTPASFLLEPAPMKEAAISIGSEIFQARTASGGEAVALDFTPGPRLSVWLTRRVMALLAPYLNMKGVVG